MKPSSPIIVAGHICVDIFPKLPQTDGPFRIEPGSLVNIGPAGFSPGGAVANVGLALHRLGMSVRLMGKTGSDHFGKALLDLLREQDPTLAASMIVSKDEPTSYSIVIEPPGIDRAFMHCSGANDTLVADDFDPSLWSDARLFHFGYPPIMPAMYADHGAELVKLFRRVKSKGLITSLDMCSVDPASPAGRVNWPDILERVLPDVDLFVPSYDELAWMLGEADVMHTEDDATLAQTLDRLSSRVLSMGAGVAAIKLGDKGLYLRVDDCPILGPDWQGQELWHPCYRADVVGTTGSGDCTVAGLIAAVCQGLSPQQAVTLATAVGACSVEHASATAGVPSLDRITQRLNDGWPTHPRPTPPDGWRPHHNAPCLIGPHHLASQKAGTGETR